MPHKRLDVWKKSIDLVVAIYAKTNCFPKEEIFGLSQQMRRSAVSISSNIAEGCSRKGNQETIQFLYIATGSLSESETQTIIANKVGFLSDVDADPLFYFIDEIKRMLIGLIKSYKEKS